MNNDLNQIWDIFIGLTEHLKNKDKKDNSNYDMDHYKKGNPSGYRLINLRTEKKHDNLKGHNSFKVLPLIEGEEPPYRTFPWDLLTKPKSKFNAIAVMHIGHRWDEYDLPKYTDGGDSARLKAAQEKVFPKFISDMDEYLNIQKIDGRPLKAQIINGKFSYFDERYFIYKQDWDNYDHQYFPYLIPLSIRISFK